MRIVDHYLAAGGNLELNEKMSGNAGKAALTVVVGAGRGCVLRVDAPLAGIWLPLRGKLQFNADAERLHAGEMRIGEADARLQVIGRGNALWMAVLGSGTAWRNAVGDLFDVPTPEPLLLPGRHMADRALRRSAIALLRSKQPETRAAALNAFLERVLNVQQSFAAAIARCPGRTYAQRRQVFLRLQRVRNYLAANCQLEIDNVALARMASYSPWHFIRAFRAAYEETPHAYLVRQRLERARRLLRMSPLAVAEVALASGFENRCAFSRLFRQRFGRTALQLRRDATLRIADAGAPGPNAQLRQRGLPI